jgi:hypothetical protein
MKTIAIAMAAVLLSVVTARAQTTEIVLSCNGTSKVDDQEHPLRNGRLVINLSNNTIASFGVVSAIDRIDNAIISFQGKRTFDGKGEESTLYTSLSGQIDRITGKAIIMVYDYGYRDNIETSFSSRLNLICMTVK